MVHGTAAAAAAAAGPQLSTTQDQPLSDAASTSGADVVCNAMSRAGLLAGPASCHPWPATLLDNATADAGSLGIAENQSS
jgi:hypothetical protein